MQYSPYSQTLNAPNQPYPARGYPQHSNTQGVTKSRTHPSYAPRAPTSNFSLMKWMTCLGAIAAWIFFFAVMSPGIRDPVVSPDYPVNQTTSLGVISTTSPTYNASLECPAPATIPTRVLGDSSVNEFAQPPEPMSEPITVSTTTTPTPSENLVVVYIEPEITASAATTTMATTTPAPTTAQTTVYTTTQTTAQSTAYTNQPTTPVTTTAYVAPPVTQPTPSPTTTTVPTTAPTVYIPPYTHSELAKEITHYVNIARVENGAEPISLGNGLMQMPTEIRVTEIRENFSHTRPNGTRFLTAFNEFGIDYYRIGENLLFGHESLSAEDMVQEWMQSSSHRANIINNDYTHMNIAYYYCDSSVFVVQHFYDLT